MTKTAAAFLTCAVLAGCGGGSTSGNDDTPAFGRGDPKIEFFPQKPSLLSNRSGFPVDQTSPYFTQVNVKITDDNGFPAPGLTIVDMQISNGNIFSLSTSPFGAYNPAAVFGCNGTSSSIATYYFAAGPQAGTAQVTASVTAPLASGAISDGVCTTTTPTGARNVRKTFDYTVNVGPEPFVRLAAAPGRTTLPINTFNVPPTPGSPFLTPVEVTQKTSFGALVNGGVVRVSVARPDIIQLSIADKPETPENELTDLKSSVDANIVAGKALFYVHSRQRSGTAVVNIFATEQDSAGFVTPTFGIDLSFTVGSSVASISQLAITSDTRPVYTVNSNGNAVLPIQIRATDDAGEGVSDAAAGVNNILLEIINPNGETLVSTNAAGASVEGTSIRTRTSQSIASTVFRAAARQGLVQIRATADRADNNVDNGIQSPIFATKAVTVSDGKLFDIKLTGSVLDVLRARRDITTEFPSPGAQNGTYGIVIGASATDRQGNPVLPGTVIEFGMIDSPTVGYPLSGPGTFEIAGLDGDPVEGGQRFTAPSGRFTTAGGGAGPGDTLILFGEESNPIRDLESARLISRVNGPGSLDIISSTRFNLNDDSSAGTAVDRGPVVPYVMGRASIGNVTNTRLTNQFGVVNTTINYPVSRIGHAFVLWARGFGDTPVGQTTAELVTDADAGRFPAAAGVTLIASPTSIVAGAGSLVQICLRDGFSNPIPAVFVGYGFSKAIGTVDGGTTGVVRDATGFDGCTVALVRATLTGTEDGEIIFSGAGKSQSVSITKGGGAAQLFAIPGVLGGNGGTVTLRLVDGTGAPIPNVQIAGKCDSNAGLSVPPGSTNQQGETTAVITANLNRPAMAGTAVCEFEAFGSKALVSLKGVDICNLGFSPPPPGCPPATPPTPLPSTTLTVNLQKADGGAYVLATGPQVQVIGNAGGINCVSANPTNCIGSSIPNGTTVALTASTGINGLPNAASFCRWTGAPGCFGTQPTVQVNMTGNLTCVAVFSETGPAGCPTF